MGASVSPLLSQYCSTKSYHCRLAGPPKAPERAPLIPAWLCTLGLGRLKSWDPCQGTSHTPRSPAPEDGRSATDPSFQRLARRFDCLQQSTAGNLHPHNHHRRPLNPRAIGLNQCLLRLAHRRYAARRPPLRRRPSLLRPPLASRYHLVAHFASSLPNLSSDQKAARLHTHYHSYLARHPLFHGPTHLRCRRSRRDYLSNA